jgi:hypothetical protein
MFPFIVVRFYHIPHDISINAYFLVTFYHIPLDLLLLTYITSYLVPFPLYHPPLPIVI